jgi:hypothetical protein
MTGAKRKDTDALRAFARRYNLPVAAYLGPCRRYFGQSPEALVIRIAASTKIAPLKFVPLRGRKPPLVNTSLRC